MQCEEIKVEINVEKKEKILKAAIHQFTKGYKNASTILIAKEASVSKGIIFHYFQTKEKLFLECIDYASEMLIKEYLNKIDYSQKDLLSRFESIAQLKISFLNYFPNVYQFFMKVYKNHEAEYPVNLLQNFQKKLEEYQTILFKGIDLTLLKEGLDYKKIIKVVFWTVIGFSDEILEGVYTLDDYLKKNDQIMEEFNQYLSMFRVSFYK